jgi:hypothetical protein
MEKLPGVNPTLRGRRCYGDKASMDSTNFNKDILEKPKIDRLERCSSHFALELVTIYLSWP